MSNSSPSVKKVGKKKVIKSLLQFVYDDCEMQVQSLTESGDTSWDVSDVHNWEAMSTHLSKIAELLNIKLRD